MEQQLFKISGVRAIGGANFERYTLEDALVKASEMMQGGIDHLAITTPDGEIIGEAKILELIDRATNADRSLRRSAPPT
jgi:hypothetical protein